MTDREQNLIQRIKRRLFGRDAIEFSGWQESDERPHIDHPDGFEYGGSFDVTVNGKPTGIEFDVFVDDPAVDHPHAEIYISDTTRECHQYND